MLELNNMSLRKYVTLFIGGSTDNLRNTYGSWIAEHFINNCDCAEKFIVDLYFILSNSHSSFHLKVLETIHILSGRPSLCKQRECLLGINFISIWSLIQYFSYPKYCYIFFLLLFYDIFFDLAGLSVERNRSTSMSPFFVCFLCFYSHNE